MGEPLANYKRVIEAVHRITAPAPDGLGISQRTVTVSTVGLVPARRPAVSSPPKADLGLPGLPASGC